MNLTESHLKDITAIANNFHKSTRLDYDDLYQQAAIGYIKANLYYDNSIGTSFITFAHSCAVNSVINFVREERKFKYVSFLEMDYKVTPTNIFMLYDAIEHLRTYYKEPLKLFIQGYKYREIAQMLNININTLKILLHRAKKELKEI